VDNGKLSVIEFCQKVRSFLEEPSPHHTLLWWKNLELGSNVTFTIDGRPMAPDRIYNTFDSCVSVNVIRVG